MDISAFTACGSTTDEVIQRIIGVNQTWGYAMALADAMGLREALKSYLVRMHDHKGCLTCVWVQTDEPVLQQIMQQAWDKAANEYEIEHISIDAWNKTGDLIDHLRDSKFGG